MSTKKILTNDINLFMLTHEKNSNDYLLIATHDNKQVGYCSFCFQNGCCKLNRIAVTNQKFLSKGVGSLLFECMENFAYENQIDLISAVFIPRGYDDAWSRTAKFYEHMNMTTFANDFDFCERDEISKSTTKMVNPPKFKLIANDAIYKKFFEYNFNTNDIFSSGSKPNKNPEPSMVL